MCHILEEVNKQMNISEINFSANINDVVSTIILGVQVQVKKIYFLRMKLSIVIIVMSLKCIQDIEDRFIEIL